MPQSSIFSSEYSRGPLYQYWKERSAEEKATREQRIEEAKLRSKGFRPLSPASGPSSAESYLRRATSGPPGYVAATAGGGGNTDGDGNEEELTPPFPAARTSRRDDTTIDPDVLPSYTDAMVSASPSSSSPPRRTQPALSSSGNPLPLATNLNHDSQQPSIRHELLSAEEEKSRLAQLEAQRRQIDQDAALARTLSSVQDSTAAQGEMMTPTPTPRRKSTTSKIGGWIADAATGYSKRQERF